VWSLRGDPHRMQGYRYWIQGGDPFYGRSLFLHFFYSVGQYHCHGKLSRGHELCNQGLTSAELDILLRESFHEALGLFSPGHGHGGIPRVHLLIHGDFALPLRVKQIVPTFWRVLLWHQLRVVADDIVGIEVVYPVSLVVLESFG
jgi:hypothetical protein